MTAEMNEQEKALALMRATHDLVCGVYAVLGERPVSHGLKSALFNSSQDVITGGRFECGSVHHVLGRALKKSRI